MPVLMDDHTIQIRVNGQERAVPPALHLTALVEQLQPGPRRLAVEINGEIVPRSAWAQTELQDGDRVEIVQAIGGG
jgi:sulfur carrier protein